MVNKMMITEKDLPLYMVETKHRDGTWHRFTIMPFPTKESATEHMRVLLTTYNWSQDDARVAEYTLQHYRDDLIKLILTDEDAIRRALSIIRTDTLAELVK
jgi:hypothetical protein